MGNLSNLLKAGVAGLAFLGMAATANAAATLSVDLTGFDQLLNTNTSYLDMNGPDSFHGTIVSNGLKSGVVITDDYTGASASSSTGSSFKFTYQFQLGAATNAASGYTFDSGVDQSAFKYFGMTMVDTNSGQKWKATVNTDSASTLGQYVINASNLKSTDNYQLVVYGGLADAVNQAGFTTGFTGNVAAGNPSPVPVPGALLLFGSGLLGLGGLARRRKASAEKSTGKTLLMGAAVTAGALVALPVIAANPASAATSAVYTETVETLDLGLLPVTTKTASSYLDTLVGKVSGAGAISETATGATVKGALIGTKSTVTSTSSALPAASYQYKFSLAGAEKIDMKLTTSGFSLPAADFTLVKLNGNAIDTSWTAPKTIQGTGFLEIVAGLQKGSYEAIVNVPTLLKNTIVTDSFKVSSVPVPAALPMFGAAIFGLGALARRRRNAKSA